MLIDSEAQIEFGRDRTNYFLLSLLSPARAMTYSQLSEYHFETQMARRLME